ncbi:hypothetical protein CEXT_449721, partial [Caerostris extrusa]
MASTWQFSFPALQLAKLNFTLWTPAVVERNHRMQSRQGFDMANGLGGNQHSTL